jgi:signal transduction histidine kinase
MAPEIITPEQLENLLSAEASLYEAPETTYNSPFLHLLVSADRGQLTQSFREFNFAPGEVVFYDGDEGDTMFLIWSGKIAIIKGDLDSPIILAYRGPGEIFGEMAILENQPRSATIVALEHLRVLELNRQRFDQLLSETPSVSRSIMEILSARLRKVSQERSTGQLSEKRLSRQVSDLQSEKQRLEDLQRLRQETTELIIHDLRNPLSSIAVSLKLISLMLPEDVLNANHGILSIGQASCERMQRLVDSLLEVSRLETGEVRFRLEAVKLPEIINETIQRTSILSRPGTTMRSVIEPGLPPVLADRDKIDRVIMNLLDNALKYTPEGGQISVSVTQEREGFVKVSVSDDGPGIPPDERERIFERFAQVANGQSRQRGFGLGLTYCRLAVEGHGGTIWVEPGDGGRGSCFTFTLQVAAS